MRVFVYTKHAETILSERKIERAWVELTVTNPDMLEPDPGNPATLRAWRKIPERDGRMLRVVYSRDGDAVRIITTFFDRGRRR